MSIPPDWYLDPTNRHERRYWDGSRWTDHVRDGSATATDPVDAGPRVELRPLDSDPADEPSAPTWSETSEGFSQENERRADAAQPPDDATGDASADPAEPAGQTDQTASPRTTGTDPGRGADEPQPWTGRAEGGYDAFARSSGLTAADARPRYAHALARGGVLVALVSLLLSLTVVLGLVGVIGGLAALVVGLRARRRLIDLGDTDQTTAVRAALLGVFTALVGTVATVLLVALWADGEVIRFVACTEQQGVGSCVADLVREIRVRLTP
ncbi:MAG: DUF2510 domain-containing protein [Nitriliruptoraceae bacterium]